MAKGKPRAALDELEATLLFYSHLPFHAVAKELGVRGERLRVFWRGLFGEEACKRRTSDLHRRTKLGERNPMYGRRGDDAPASRYKGELSPMWGKTGENSHAYRKDAKLMWGSYKAVRAPDWWEGTTLVGLYALEHRVVYAESKGWTDIPAGKVVHHINGDKLDNRIENLELMDHSEHSRLHNIGKIRNPRGRGNGKRPSSP